MSTLAVNTITDSTGGSTTKINGMTPTATSLQGFRNRIINGAMVIDQRNAGASVNASNGRAFGVDRFPVDDTSTMVVACQQSTTAPAGFINSLYLSVSTAKTPAATDYCLLRQDIEGFNIADLGWGTAAAQSVTLSFWVRSSITGTYAISIRNASFNRTYIATYTINSANTFEYKTITIPGDTTGTWATNNTIGFDVCWDLGSGSNYQAAAGSWSAGVQTRTSGTVSWVATTSATFYITGVQLEVGSVATNFEQRPYGTELALCQRYYEKTKDSGGQITGYGYNTNQYFQILWKVTKRATGGTVSYSDATTSNVFAMYGNTGTSASIAGILTGGLTTDEAGVDHLSFYSTTSASTYTPYGTALLGQFRTNQYIAYSAEL